MTAFFEAGKGDSPRGFTRAEQERYANNYDAIFRKKKDEAEYTEVKLEYIPDDATKQATTDSK